MQKKVNGRWLEHIRPTVIKFLLFITKGEILYIAMAAIIAVLIIFFALKSDQNINNVIEFSTFSAIVLEGGLVAIIRLLRTIILKHTEDPGKLTDNYQSLVDRYKNQPNLVWKKVDGAIITLPVIHVAWLVGKTIEIDDHPDNEYQLPPTIVKHYEELFRAHSASKVYNNVNIRVDDWYWDNDTDSFKVVTGRTSYYDSLVTNRAMDYEFEKGISVRKLLECGPMVRPLKNSLLSNHLGINGFVESSDGEIIFVKRKSNISIGKKTFGNSIGASLKTKYALNNQSFFTKEGLIDGIIEEINDELGIAENRLITSQYDEKITIIAAYRDMLEGGKPQLLFYARTSMKKPEIDEIKNSPNKKSPKSDSNEMITDGDELYWIKREDIEKCNVRVHLNGIQHKDDFLKMVPSATACVVMLVEYLESNGNPSTTY